MNNNKSQFEYQTSLINENDSIDHLNDRDEQI